jgi:prefoldin subunit 5
LREAHRELEELARHADHLNRRIQELDSQVALLLNGRRVEIVSSSDQGVKK